MAMRADAAAAGKAIAEEAVIHRIRITLTSRNVKSLEKVCADLIKGAKTSSSRSRVRCEFPPRLFASPPVKRPAVKVPKLGTGSRCVHKRVIDLHSPSEIVKQITSISIEPGVE